MPVFKGCAEPGTIRANDIEGFVSGASSIMLSETGEMRKFKYIPLITYVDRGTTIRLLA